MFAMIGGVPVVPRGLLQATVFHYMDPVVMRRLALRIGFK
jgi:hypothetical protein